MTWLVVGIGLVLVIFVHELGHFSVAMAVKMRPRSFYVFFPPALVKMKRNGIEYGIGMIPLGGLVRIPGMHRPAARDLRAYIEPALREQPELTQAAGAVRRALDVEDYGEARRAYMELEREVAGADLTPGTRRSAERGLREVEEGTAPDAYWHAATWKRVAVIAAGPAANVLLAFLILFVVFSLSGGPSQRPTATVADVESGTPAAASGLQIGDRIVGVDGRRTRGFSEVSRLIRSSHGAEVTLTVVRNGRRVTVGPRHTIHEQGRWIFGFSPSATLVKYPVAKAATTASSDLWGVVTSTGHRPQGPVLASGPQPALRPGRDRRASRTASCELGLTLLPRDPRVREHVARADQPAAAAAARRRPHPLLADRGRPAPRPRPRGLRARLGRRDSRSSCSCCVIAFSNDFSGHAPH